MDISVRGLSVALGGQRILHNIDAHLPSGSSVAVTGMSGVGKTTFLRALAGLIEVSTGEVLVGGNAPGALYGRGVLSFLFQEACLWPHLTLEASLALTYRLHGLQPDAGEVRRHLAAAGLADAAKKFPYQLSVGMKARAALARAFCVPPQVLLLDEAFAAVDLMRRLDLNRQVQRLRESHGCTVVWITHDVVEALEFGTHVACLAGNANGGLVLVDVTSLPPIHDRGRLPTEVLVMRDRLLSTITDGPSGKKNGND